MITSNMHTSISLSQTEASYDFARIYEGSYDCNGNNVVLQEWHGSKQPEYHYFDYDQISVRFTSDGSYNVWGFELVVTLVDQGWYILAIHFQTRVYTVLKTKAGQTVVSFGEKKEQLFSLQNGYQWMATSKVKMYSNRSAFHW